MKPTAALPTGEWHTFRAEVQGSSLKLYVNGELMLTAVDPDLRHGAFGLMHTEGDVRYDDVTVNPHTR
ncbi:MAG: DUF1080 domain-containing protein [Firmicutes bacterium]|nr:DUF1080 domain-containing protein [Bacillota bacterium]